MEAEEVHFRLRDGHGGRFLLPSASLSFSDLPEAGIGFSFGFAAAPSSIVATISPIFTSVRPAP
jgi:hypothetical protein